MLMETVVFELREKGGSALAGALNYVHSAFLDNFASMKVLLRLENNMVLGEEKAVSAIAEYVRAADETKNILEGNKDPKSLMRAINSMSRETAYYYSLLRSFSLNEEQTEKAERLFNEFNNKIARIAESASLEVVPRKARL
ncbi:MAG: hypothetical protein M1360_00555 [Candidatus Marsarchaeota archaeon]|nr:hypothetical protein [Candidatus Marsarchaeota archaeon]